MRFLKNPRSPNILFSTPEGHRGRARRSLETTLPGVRWEEKGCRRPSRECTRVCTGACVRTGVGQCVIRPPPWRQGWGYKAERHGVGWSKATGDNNVQGQRWGELGEFGGLGDTAIRLFVSVALKYMPRLAGAAARGRPTDVHEVPSLLKEPRGVQTWEHFIPSLREFTVQSFIRLTFIQELLLAGPCPRCWE